MGDNIRKVTFYDNVVFDTQEVSGSVIPVLTNSHDNAIYFTPTTGSGSTEPKHIAHGGQFYTLGSKLKTVTDEIKFSPINYGTGEMGETILIAPDNENQVSFMYSGESDVYKKDIEINNKYIDFGNLITAFNALSRKLEVLQQAFNKLNASFSILVEFTGIYGTRYNKNVAPYTIGEKSENSIKLYNGESFILTFGTNPETANPQHLYDATVKLYKNSTYVNSWTPNADLTSPDKLIWNGSSSSDFSISNSSEDYNIFSKTSNNIDNYKFTIEYKNEGDSEVKSKTLDVNYNSIPVKVYGSHIDNSGKNVTSFYKSASNSLTVNSTISELNTSINGLTGKLSYDDNYWHITDFITYSNSTPINSTDTTNRIYNDSNAINHLYTSEFNDAYYPVKANVALYAYGFRYRTSYYTNTGTIAYTSNIGNAKSFKMNIDNITEDGVNIYSNYINNSSIFPTIPGNHFETKTGSNYNMFVTDLNGNKKKNINSETAGLKTNDINDLIIGSYVNIWSTFEPNTGSINVSYDSTYFTSTNGSVNITYGQGTTLNYSLKTTNTNYTYTAYVTIDNLTKDTDFTYTNTNLTIKNTGISKLLLTNNPTPVNVNIRCNVKINIQNNPLSVSKTSLSVNTGATDETITITNPSGGTLTATSSDSTKVSVEIVENKLKITGIAGGSATITVKSAATSNYKEGSKTISVTVKQNYYYYAGWTCPTNEEELATLAVEPNGKVIENYETMSSGTQIRLFDGELTHDRGNYYIVVPSGVGLFGPDGGNRIEDSYTEITSEITGYKIYTSRGSRIEGVMIKKI